MSKLSDKIRRATQVSPHALGFVTSRAAAESSMVLAGRARDAKGASEAAKRGADIVILGSRDSSASPGDAKDLGQTISGAWISGKTDDEAATYRDGGFDFVLFDPDRTAATAVLDEGIGYVLSQPSDLTDLEVRALADFRLDAIYVGKIDALTVRRQIELQRIFGMTRKPLMADVSANTSVAEMRTLRDANVVVVAVDGADNVEKLRKTIDALPPRTRRRDDERPTPLVPTAAAAAGHDHDDDED